VWIPVLNVAQDTSGSFALRYAALAMSKPNTLAALIAQVESDNNPDAIRYDPNYVPDPTGLILAEKFNRCDANTATMLCRISWGLYQLEGDTLYLHQWEGSLAEYLASPNEQLRMFNRFVSAHGINYSVSELVDDAEKRASFAHHYNGAIVAYGAQLLRSLELETAAGHPTLTQFRG
jgi:hypothetical protein